MTEPALRVENIRKSFGGHEVLKGISMSAAKGDIYYGLWYPIVVALGTFIIGLIFVPETKDRDIYSID